MIRKLSVPIVAAIAAVAIFCAPGMTVAKASPMQPAKGGLHGWIFYGVLRPIDNPGWCLTMRELKDGSPIILLPCAKLFKGISADARQNWVGIKAYGVGDLTQMSTGEFELAQLGKSKIAVGINVGDHPTADWQIRWYTNPRGNIDAIVNSSTGLFLQVQNGLRTKHLRPYYAKWDRKMANVSDHWIHNDWIPYHPD